VPFRLVVAVQQPVGQLVTSGQWRSDFAYRVAGIILKVPPLRERISDIGPLSQRFLAELGCAPLSTEALGVLERHDWPGNVRELRRVLERAALRSVCGSVTPDQLIAAIDAAFEPGPDEDGDVLTSGDRPTLAELERKYLRQVLREAEFDVRESARVLGMPASTLYRRLRAMGIGLRPVPDYQK
jgi:DNA-binding NtrC family response regulator